MHLRALKIFWGGGVGGMPPDPPTVWQAYIHQVPR